MTLATITKVVLLLPILVAGNTNARAQALEIDLPGNSIGYSTSTHKLYATIPSSAGLPYGNRLVEISAVDATITNSVFVGSEPGPLAISPDAAIAYIGLNGAAAVRPVDLTSLTAGLQFTLGNSDYDSDQLYASQISVMPGSPNTVAVSRADIAIDPSFQGVAIFDSGMMRPTVTATFIGPTSIAFGSSPSVLFGYDNESSNYGLYNMVVDSSGVSISSSADHIISGYGVTIVADGDTIYATSGRAVEGMQLALIGTYNSSGPVVVDTATHSVIFAHQNRLQVFDRDTFIPNFSIAIPAARGNPISATSCGSACVAVVFDSNQIFIIPNVSEAIFADGFE